MNVVVPSYITNSISSEEKRRDAEKKLITASQKGDLAEVRRLLNEGVDVNYTNEYGWILKSMSNMSAFYLPQVRDETYLPFPLEHYPRLLV